MLSLYYIINMMKQSKKIRLMLEYIGLKILVFLISLMPWGLAVKFGEIFGLLITKFTPKRYNRAKRDIQKAFPQKTPDEVDAIAKESFKNIGRMAAEFIKASRMSKEELLGRIETHNAQEVAKYVNAGRGAILHLGHFVNWEILGIWVGHVFEKVAFVAKPQGNAYSDRLLTQMRTSSGAKGISSQNPFFSCSKMIKKGYLISILSDQSVLTPAAVYMNFLGRPAEVGVMTAVLSIKLQAPVIPIRPGRRDGKIIVHAEDALIPPAEYSQQAVYDFTRRLMDKYEEWIRKSPETWLWGHNRWKREEIALKKMGEQSFND